MLKQFLQYKLSQKLSPQQIQLMKLIQLPTLAFEQRIKQELEENPALESGKEQETSYEDEFESNENDIDNDQISAEDINVDDYLSDDEIPEYRLSANNYSADDEEKTMPFASGSSFTQLLIDQLNTFSLNDNLYQIAEFLIGSIDDSGYIRLPLLDIMDDLREKCPWDKKQTFESLRHLTIEETYELADAIIDNDLKSIEGEVGDLFLHLVFYCKLGEEVNSFNTTSVLNAICEKLIYRHPHIYSDTVVQNEEELSE